MAWILLHAGGARLVPCADALNSRKRCAHRCAWLQPGAPAPGTIPEKEWQRPMLSITERRQRVLAQHETLREMVRHMLETAARIEKGALAERGTLRIQIGMLRWALELHLVDEEQLLEPVLARLNGSGAQHLAAMNEEHAQQRAVLASLESGLGGDLGARALAANAAAVGSRLLEDMDREERELLSPEALGEELR